jgi:alpha-tubulin suppressor-like RCC1 family protein
MFGILFAGLGSARADATGGFVVQWGYNTGAGKKAPTQVISSNAVAVAAGRVHTLALEADGRVLGSGANLKGEACGEQAVGHYVTNQLVKIEGRILKDVVSVAAGEGFGLALKKDGTLVTWGVNYIPDIVSNNVMSIAAAGFDSLAVKSNGTIVEWESEKSLPGYDQAGVVEGISNVTAVAIGRTYQGVRRVALKRDGTVVFWGSQSIYNDATPPPGLGNVVAIAAGSAQSLAVLKDGTVTGWGFNKAGQATGVPNTNEPYISAGKVTINGNELENVVAIAAGEGYSMALKKDGTVVTWGRMVNDLYPTFVPDGLNGVIVIAAGEFSCFAITTNAAVAARFERKGVTH